METYRDGFTKQVTTQHASRGGGVTSWVPPRSSNREEDSAKHKELTLGVYIFLPTTPECRGDTGYVPACH